MIRQELARSMDHDPHFKWRGTDVTRLENLSDIVFAIAFGMIVMSGDAPRTFEDLNQFLIGLVPVIFAFVVMMYIWNAHFLFFRRYSLADATVVFANGVLLLFVLVIAYPLRFIFDSLYGYLLLLAGYPDYVIDLRIDFRRAGIIMGYFTAGFLITELIFTFLYAYALKKADQIGLSADERTLTRRTVWIFATGAGWAALACTLAVLTPLGGFAGFFLNGTAITSPLIRRRMRAKGE
ncbi:DUF1211 domain-containing protein [Parvularcula sp. ZS-1/3]|uniref:DUF1211 domain-containing protein n=1 Tax=Parvularcula mediterranea TaxID=2732508 RepID=A0A7Y3RIX3_9PROT|nr:TMEM175 family protein [Parvularcula mediterranea]NNU14923.1 DUF1211 domain-containing protein [Parvularcula mediterranea]